MRRLLSFVVVLGGCVPNSQGLGMESTPGLGPAESSGTGDVFGSTSPSPGDEPTASADGTSTGREGTSTTTTSSTDSSSSGEPELPASCAEILEADPAAPTGTHVIARPSDGMEIKVHCEMELDGGGWTLVGRSEPGGPPAVPFGWGQSTGIVGDPNNPYSLNVVEAGLPFEEILVTHRDDYAIPVGNAYVIKVPPGFVNDYDDEALQHMSTRTVLGGCDPMPPPTMLSWVGRTNRDDLFFLRDNPNNDGNFGLRPRGFDLAHGNCNQGADLDGDQGALFVR